MLYRMIDSGRNAISEQLHVMVKHQLLSDEQLGTDECRLNQALQDRQNLKVDFFGSAAPQWDTIRSQWFGDTFHLEAMLALLNPEWTIGDLGAGTGATFSLVAPHVKKVIAIEPSAPMLKAARNRIRMAHLENVELLAGRMEHLPIEDQMLDAALIVLVLHHVADIESAATQVQRVLKPGGVVLIVDLLPHSVEMFRDKMGHRWMGFAPDRLAGQLQCRVDRYSPPYAAIPKKSFPGKPRGCAGFVCSAGNASATLVFAAGWSTEPPWLFRKGFPNDS